MSLADFALRLDGVPQETIDLIDKATPAAERLIALVDQAQPMIDEALALIAKATPLVTEANAQLKTIMPAAMAVRAFIQKQQTPTPPPADRFGAGSA